MSRPWTIGDIDYIVSNSDDGEAGEVASQIASLSLSERLRLLEKWLEEAEEQLKEATMNSAKIKALLDVGEEYLDLENDRNEWRQQHENLLAIRQQECQMIAELKKENEDLKFKLDNVWTRVPRNFGR
jgi:chromosome segregation ATPase